MKLGIISLGCSKNLVDTEQLLGILQNAQDITIVQYPSEAEVIVINTCGFIQSAKEEAINTILEMAEYKEKGTCQKLIVMGCLAQRYKKELEEELPEVDLFLTFRDYPHMNQILSQELGVTIPQVYGKQRLLSAKPWMAYVRIADGCDNKCSYCAIPLIRGPYCSRPLDEVVQECRELVSQGVKEINLIAQDTTRFGTDRGKRELPELLTQLNTITDLHWIRILYMYPDEIDDRLIQTMAVCEKVLPYFDIPMQHASNTMLHAMNRRGTYEDLCQIVEKLRQAFSHPVLRTTLITGFPHETPEDVQANLKMIRDIRWDRLGVFTYSHEADTPAWEMEDDIAEEEKEKRRDTLMQAQQKVVDQNNAALVGTVLEVLVEKVDAITKIYRGRSVLNAPDGVDGEVLFKSEKEIPFGSFVSVTIQEARHYDLFGTLKEEAQ